MILHEKTIRTKHQTARGDHMISNEAVISFFRQKTNRPLSFRDIVSFMKLNHKEARALKGILRDMVRNGDIVLTTKRPLRACRGDEPLIRGYFDQHKDGYGFVIMEKPGERDIFIPARWTMGAMNNDRVLVRVENWQMREGQIIRILERTHTKLAGKI